VPFPQEQTTQQTNIQTQTQQKQQTLTDGTQPVASITKDDVSKYDQLFLKADVDGDQMVDGKEARDFFLRANLPKETLSKIW
jgi:hypothetical protein